MAGKLRFLDALSRALAAVRGLPGGRPERSGNDPASGPTAGNGPGTARLNQLEKALETMQVGVTITDLDGRILFVNRAEAEMHGYSKGELVGRSVEVFAPRELRRPMRREELGEVRSWRRESVNLRRDGSQFPVEMLSDVVVGEEGHPAGVVSICQDISERKRAERALEDSEERYALALVGSNDGIWDWNLASGEVFLSARWKSMLGLDPEDAVTAIESWWNRVHPDDLDQLARLLGVHLRGDSRQFECEHRMLHENGAYRWMLSRGVAVRDAEGEPTRMAGSLTDITDRKVRDPLTGLPNRALFLDRLSNAIARAKRRPQCFAVLFLDLDRFKVVNDSLGHLAGDRLLTLVARDLERCLRPCDTVARFGGDEFTILVEEIDGPSGIEPLVERLHRQLDHPYSVSGQEVFVSVSVGVALGCPEHTDPRQLLHDADTAMYRAKRLGGAGFAVYDGEMRRDAIQRLQLETELRRGLEHGEIVVRYQPIVSLSDQRLTGFEALAGWSHPRRGLLPREDFLPLAEETGLVVELGLRVLDQACRQMRVWDLELPGASDLTMNVGLSPRQLSQPDLVDKIQRLLQNHGLPGKRLKVAVTEEMLGGRTAILPQLERLQAFGVKVCLDGFGTGCLSLVSLQELPVDELKIDRGFLLKAGADAKTTEIVRLILRLATELKLAVVAAGVENGITPSRFEDMLCGCVEGLTPSHPLDAEGAERLLRRQLGT